MQTTWAFTYLNHTNDDPWNKKQDSKAKNNDCHACHRFTILIIDGNFPLVLFIWLLRLLRVRLWIDDRNRRLLFLRFSIVILFLSIIISFLSVIYFIRWIKWSSSIVIRAILLVGIFLISFIVCVCTCVSISINIGTSLLTIVILLAITTARIFVWDIDHSKINKSAIIFTLSLIELVKKVVFAAWLEQAKRDQNVTPFPPELILCRVLSKLVKTPIVWANLTNLVIAEELELI